MSSSPRVASLLSSQGDGFKPNLPKQLLLWLCASPLLAVQAMAQTPPDAGSLLQQQRQSSPQLLPPSKDQTPRLRQAVESTLTGGRQVQVQRFELAGNLLLNDASLQSALADYRGRKLGLGELQRAAAAVSEAYAQAGWLARVYLPPQDITDGVISLQIEEARFGALRFLDSGNTRFNRERAQAMVAAQQAPSAALNLNALDRTLLLLSDLPGVSSSGSLVAGSAAGETDLLLKLEDGPLLIGDVGGDNAGSRSTGAARLNAGLGLNGWLGRGDALSANLSHTEGSDYGRFAVSAPLGVQGWRAGANASSMRYQLVGADFAALQSKGRTSTRALDASFPLLRSRERNLTVQFSVEHKDFYNEANGSVSSDYRSRTVSAGLSGNLFDSLGGGGANAAGLLLNQGELKLAGSPNAAVDAAGPKTQGSFTKLRYAFSRQQMLSRSLSAYLGLAGQYSDRNLDSSEKFYLGGAQGVRAYPSSESGGARGRIVNLELRASLPGIVPGDLRGVAFYDWGRVQVNVDNSFAGAPKINQATLQGAGLSIAWTGPQNLDLRATLARRSGGNPLANPAGLDQDGTLKRSRLWLQASLPF
ncbi:BamA/TamA family outer membrane protein [Paucibacter sp. B2R-40]|uniref:ShlB/FhaC/HecB family hemolysin secretion/activation protein n=1 Tax=Paucibacter sp. B2R-40 TaxID=2893554 RepID=UPI0021E4E439|nr:ShlB/FhaC/HecB family hemolysin secretion/activation protein [Paucibacter sp. B2R-40]MCV2355109.1 BamA/TamA family outer membrane protein [Paucibacter sp. B2R-40]